EIFFLRLRRQLSREEKVADLQEVAVLGKLLDRVAAMEQNTFVAVAIGDLRLAACGGGKAGVVGEHPRLLVQRRYVYHVGADRSLAHRVFAAISTKFKFYRRIRHRTLPLCL